MLKKKIFPASVEVVCPLPLEEDGEGEIPEEKSAPKAKKKVFCHKQSLVEEEEEEKEHKEMGERERGEGGAHMGKWWLILRSGSGVVVVKFWNVQGEGGGEDTTAK